MGQMGEFNVNALASYDLSLLSPPSPSNTVTPEDILHCLTRFGQQRLDIETLHRVDTFFGHQGRFLKGYERLYHNPVYSWLVDHFSTIQSLFDPVLNERRRVVMDLYRNYCTGTEAGNKPATIFMHILQLAHAVAPDTVMGDIPTLPFPTERGQPHWLFTSVADIRGFLVESTSRARFNADHPGGEDSLNCRCPVASTARPSTGPTAPSAGW